MLFSSCVFKSCHAHSHPTPISRVPGWHLSWACSDTVLVKVLWADRTSRVHTDPHIHDSYMYDLLQELPPSLRTPSPTICPLLHNQESRGGGGARGKVDQAESGVQRPTTRSFDDSERKRCPSSVREHTGPFFTSHSMRGPQIG